MPKHKKRKKEAESRADKKAQSACSICSQLEDREIGFQSGGRPQYDKYLPAAVNELKLVRDYERTGGRELHLLQCGQCETYYVYRTDYEFLVGGSEDLQALIRLSAADGRRYLKASMSQVRGWTDS